LVPTDIAIIVFGFEFNFLLLRRSLGICRARVKGDFTKPIRTTAAKEVGQEMSAEKNGCAPGSKTFVVRNNTGPFPVHVVVFAGRFPAKMKPCLIFKTDGDSPVEGQPNFAGNLTQPAVPVLASKPAIQPRRGGG
jgi:hypothetical protein